MALIHLNFDSKYLVGNTDVNIILPEAPHTKDPKDVYNSREKFKVLWLLHGTNGDYSDWVRKSNVELYANEYRIAVVMPSAGNSNYADWNSFAMGYEVYTYFTEELMPLVYSWFPISDKREDNFIAGLSMGGKGAFLFALNHPEKFAKAYSFSSAPRPLKEPDPEAFSYKRESNQIRNFGSLEAYKDSPNNLWDLSEKAVQENVDLPELYFACGDKDLIAYDSFVKFREYAKEIKLKAQFFEIPEYAHEWRFWDLCLQDCLARFLPDRNNRPLFD